ncbi:hypothetical protein shim_16220 [Shimia sp. SK013]|uniref:M15 family metallopeptidase n=1 Tax=Shimia sp. SK013 TaxID=1389006 RepID=UPI0006B45D85|nr:M15 family metallopeptidase [Shimia sp. SK013]KPA22175.1 hypothetical protein shim_16220 [Shimia sp. SK013]
MFKLSRAGNNMPAEVQRWQYFLLKRGIVQVGVVDSSFGGNTELGTKIFQMEQGLSAHGRVDEETLAAAEGAGYSILNGDYYAQRSSSTWPPKPSGLASPSSAWRNQLFKCFEFLQKPLHQRSSKESIVIKGSCDGAFNDWEEEFITNVPDDRMQFAASYNGYFRCHKYAKPAILGLMDAWEEADLMHLVISYAGCYVSRYIRGGAPDGSGGHSTRQSSATTKLSNHSFGSAFDICTTWNWLGDRPAICGQTGSVRELVEIANAHGFYWGGHYTNRKDGMHFELTEVS